MRVFARRGLQRATHNDIAEECGVVVGTVFLYFPTREALVSAVLAEFERESAAIATRCYGGDAAAPQSILRHVRESLDLVDRKPEYALVWLDWSTAVREETWPRYLTFQDRAVETMAKSILLGQELGTVATRESPETCARLIASSTMMLAQMHFTRQPRERIEAFANAVVNMALGLRERGHRS